VFAYTKKGHTMKRSQRLRLIPVALVALIGALPAAVSHATPVTTPARTHAGTKVDVRFANFIDPKQIPLVEKMILPAYYKAYPRANVAFEPIPDSRVKSVTQIAAGTAADVFNLGDGDVGWYEDKGALKDLTPYANATHFSFSQYVPSTLILGHVGSHQYSLPKDYSSLAVYYNKDMFKAAGVPFPSSNWTWDEFRRDAIKLTRNGVMGFTATGDWSRLVDAVVRSLGGRLDSPNGRRVVGYMNSPASVKAITFWVNLFTKDKVALTPTQANAVNGDQFASQKAAMSITGIWPSLGNTGYRKTLKFHWAVAPFPRGTSSANTICYAGFVMSRTTKHPREAWGLIQYMSGPVGDQLWATNGLPAIKSVAEKTGATHDPVTSVFLKGASFTNLPDDLNGPAAPQGVGDTLKEGLDLLLNTPGTSVAQVLTIEARKGQKNIDSYYGGR
jgi:multiple sugar transport system substrate-binding protein